MRHRLLTATAVLLACAAPAAGQTYNDFTGTTAPVNWEPAGTGLTVVPGTSTKAIVVQAGSPVALRNQQYPGEIAFDAVIESGADVTFRLERQCGARAAEPLLDTALSAPANAAQTHRVRVRNESVEMCHFRWEAQTGRLLLANPQIVFLDQEARDRFVLRQQILRDLAERAQAVQTGSVKGRLLSSGNQLRVLSPEIAGWATDARTISSLTDYAEAVKSRADVANPLEYEQFKSIQRSVAAWTPPVAQEHLKELTSPVAEVFSLIKNVSTGNVLGLVGNLQQVGPTVRALGNTLRNLLGTAVTRSAVAASANISGSQVEAHLARFYVSNSPFLRALETEADSLTSHMRQLAALQQRRYGFTQRAEDLTAQTIRFVGLPAAPEAVEAYRLSVNKSPGTTLAARDTLDNRILVRVQSRQAAGVPITTVEADQRAVDQILQGYAALHTERVQLDLDLAAFLDNQVTHLCAVQPIGVTDTTSVRVFRERAGRAASLMREAAYGFRKARFGTPPLGDRVLKACPNQERLTREVPAVP